MIVLGYARRKGDEVDLRLICNGGPQDKPDEGGAPEAAVPPDAAGRVDGILVSREDFDFQVLDLPSVPDKEIEGLIRYRLRSLYPGSPGETTFDYVLEYAGSRRRAAVFICRKAVMEAYRSAAGRVPLLLPYCLIARTAGKRKDLRVWFCMEGWAELLVFRGGLIVSSAFRPGKEGVPFKLDEAEESLPEEVRALPALLIALAEEIERIREASGDEQPHVRFQSIPDLVKDHKRTLGLFDTRKRAPSVFTPAVRIGALAAAVAVLGLLVFYKAVAFTENRSQRLKALYASLQAQSGKVLQVQKETEALAAELSKMREDKPQDLYLLLSELSSVLGSEARIRSLTVRDNGFQAEAISASPLKLMEGFKDHAIFRDVKLSQVIPDARTGKERFSFSGVFDAK